MHRVMPCDWGTVTMNRDCAWEKVAPGAGPPEPPAIPVKSPCAKGCKRKCLLARQSMWKIEELTEGGKFWKGHGKTLDIQAGFRVSHLLITPPGMSKAQ